MVNHPNAKTWVAWAVIDMVYLRWVWIHFKNWGFWDWDYQQALLEVARISILEYGQLPLWNPYLGGGVSLAGNSLSHVWGPSLIPILLFGTIFGVKVVIAAYLLLAQLGMWKLARIRGLDEASAFFASIVFSLGGVYAQRLCHGHFEWIAIAWIPFVLFHLHGVLRPEFRRRSIGLGGLCFAFMILDGGPYQFVFFALFAGLYAFALSAEQKSWIALMGLPAIAILGAGLSAIKLLSVYEIAKRFPRATSSINFYGAPFEPSAGEILHQMFVSRVQIHDPEVWMPYVLNVGAYIGWIPLLFVAYGCVRGFGKIKIWLGLTSGILILSLGPAAPIDFWESLHQLPFFSSLRVPTRFNVFVLLLLALLAGEGFGALQTQFREKAWTVTGHRNKLVMIGLTLLVAVDMAWVNGEVFRVGFSIRPIDVERQEPFVHYEHSRYLRQYRASALYEVFPNWKSAAFPVILENRGVLRTFRAVRAPIHATSFGAAGYEGEVFATHRFESRVETFEFTPNILTFQTDGRMGRVVINQNYDPGWKLEPPGIGAVVEDQGRLAVQLDEGASQVRLVYRPTSFLWGALVSGVCVLAYLAGVLWSRRWVCLS